jgi:hypothetical protein
LISIPGHLKNLEKLPLPTSEAEMNPSTHAQSQSNFSAELTKVSSANDLQKMLEEVRQFYQSNEQKLEALQLHK